MVLLLNGKKNDLWRLSFFYVILFSVFAFDTFDPFPYFFCCYSRRKNRFTPRFPPSLAAIYFCTRKLIYEKKFLMRKNFSQRSIKITFTENSFLREIYMKSKIFPKSCNFARPSIILSQEKEWMKFIIMSSVRNKAQPTQGHENNQFLFACKTSKIKLSILMLSEQSFKIVKKVASSNKGREFSNRLRWKIIYACQQTAIFGFCIIYASV